MTDTTGPVDDAVATRGLSRLRIVVLLAGYLTVGAAACGIFDQFEWVLVAAPVLPTIAALTLLGRPAAIRALGAVSAIVVSVTLAVIANSGGAGDVIDAFTSGVQGLLSTDWPSPERADLIGTVVAVIATATAISDELAARRRFHLLPLLPLVSCYLAAVALSAPRGVTWSWLIALGAVATSFAMLRNEGTLHDRMVLLRGERRIVTLLLIAVTLIALVTVPLSLTTRADPRRNDPAEQTAPLFDPIEATLALRALDPPIDLHRITPADGGTLPTRWRTTALSNFDGRRWSPALTLRPIGNTLGPVTGPVVNADIEFLDDNLTLVPLPGAPVSVDAAVETDPDRTVVRLAEPTGDRVAIVANLAPTADDLVEQGVAPRLVDESASSLADLAAGLAGDGNAIDQLTQLETTMREEFVLDSNVQGGGLQQALIDRFLRDTQRGTAEQFATGFVLLARSLGIEARVATGFVVDGEGEGEEATAAGEVLALDLGRCRGVARGPTLRRSVAGTRSGSGRGSSRRGTSAARTAGADPCGSPATDRPATRTGQRDVGPRRGDDHRVDQCAVDGDRVGDPRDRGHRCAPAAVRCSRGSHHGDQVPTTTAPSACRRALRADPRSVGIGHRRSGRRRARHQPVGDRR